MTEIGIFADGVFSCMKGIASLYMGNLLLSGVIALFIFRKCVDVVNKLLP